MPQIRPFEPSMFDDIFETFLAKDDDVLRRTDWHRLFCGEGSSGVSRGGYVLLADNQVVGILGTLHSTRVLDGQTRRFCNLHTWHVLPDHRGHSLFMLQRAIADRSVTMTDFTPTKPVVEISKRLGLSELDSRLRVLMPIPSSKYDGRDRSHVLIEDAEAIQAVSDESHRNIVLDHADTACQHLLLEAGSRRCHIVYSRIDRWRIPYAYVQYVSDPAGFVEHHRIIRSHIASKTNTRFLAVDHRRLGDAKIPWSFKMPAGTRQLFRPAATSPSQIDCLYSELSLLRLSTMPDLGTALASLWGQN